MSVASQTAVSAFEGHHIKLYRGKQKKCPYLYSCLASSNKNLWRNEDLDRISCRPVGVVRPTGKAKEKEESRLVHDAGILRVTSAFHSNPSQTCSCFGTGACNESQNKGVLNVAPAPTKASSVWCVIGWPCKPPTPPSPTPHLCY